MTSAAVRVGEQIAQRPQAAVGADSAQEATNA
jgi:hypothetical protein